MSIWQTYLAGFAVLIWVACGHMPRARRWIELGAASFVLSTAYSRLGLPHAPVFTLCCDACICIVVYCFGKAKWEGAVFNAFRFSLLLSLLYHFNGPLSQLGMSAIQIDHWLYVVGLELCNWLALLVILDAALDEEARHGVASNRPGRSSRYRYSFAWHAARRKPPFFRTHR